MKKPFVAAAFTFLLAACVTTGSETPAATTGAEIPVRSCGEAASLNAEPGAYCMPVPGTVFRWHADYGYGPVTLLNRVASVKGYETTMTAMNGTGARSRYAGTQMMTTRTGTPLRFDENRARSLWPLAVGKATEFAVQSGPNSINVAMRVTKKETVKVPAGTFETYVIERTERAGPYSAIATYWIAPELGGGGYVKFASQELSTLGSRPEITELVEIIRP